MKSPDYCLIYSAGITLNFSYSPSNYSLNFKFSYCFLLNGKPVFLLATLQELVLSLKDILLSLSQAHIHCLIVKVGANNFNFSVKKLGIFRLFLLTVL
jgi:hypothetical protein